MIDRLFFAALTFCLLAAGTLAIVSALFEQPTRGARSVQLAPVEMRVVRLPSVQISGKRVEPGTAVARTESTEPATRNLQ